MVDCNLQDFSQMPHGSRRQADRRDDLAHELRCQAKYLAGNNNNNFSS